MGLAGIQKSFNKLDAGLHRHDKERKILDTGLRRYDKHWGHSGMTKKYVIPAWA